MAQTYKIKEKKHLHDKKSEPGANPVEQLAEKQKNIGMVSSKKTFLLKINVFKTKRAYNKPPETAVFCYTENNNKKP